MSMWPQRLFRNSAWNLLSFVTIVGFTVLQIARSPIFPQLIDIHYHLLSAWGFLQAGGYSGWDFWQYAPVGRVHIYPPLLHIILAFFLKLGISPVHLAKIFETATPVVFLIVINAFMRRHFTQRLAFFVILVMGASLSFYMSLINHIPSTAAAILGIFALDRLLRKQSLRSALLLSLCFYTHIGTSWFFLITVVICGLLNRDLRRVSFRAGAIALLLATPMFLKQIASLSFIKTIGFFLGESRFCQFKLIEYILAFFGIIICLKRLREYWLFIALFLASLVFLSYPYRFFSGEGYFPVILLSAIALDGLYARLRGRHRYALGVAGLLAAAVFIFSPTVSMEPNGSKIDYRLSFNQSAFIGMLFPGQDAGGTSKSIWVEDDFLSVAEMIQKHSSSDDIVYCSIDVLAVAFGSIAQRATSQALFPEIKAARPLDPIGSAKMIIMAQDEAPSWVEQVAATYKLNKVGANRLFEVYENSASAAKVSARKSSVPFWAIILLGLIWVLFFWRVKN